MALLKHAKRNQLKSFTKAVFNRNKEPGKKNISSILLSNRSPIKGSAVIIRRLQLPVLKPHCGGDENKWQRKCAAAPNMSL